MSKDDERLTFAMLLDRSELTQAALAEIVNVRQATVSSWVTGKSVPTLTPVQIKKLLVALNCSLDELVEVYEPNTPTSS